MLARDPKKRPSLKVVLRHPFVSGNPNVVRLLGDPCRYDVFISYRYGSDFEENNHVKQLYDALVAHGLKVFWDQRESSLGPSCSSEFFRGLLQSRYAILLISRNSINHPTNPRQSFACLTEDSPCDNVLLEYRAALELRALGYLKEIMTILIGDRDPCTGQYSDLLKGPDGLSGLPNSPDCCVLAVEEELERLMLDGAVGTPLTPNQTVSAVMAEIGNCRGHVITGHGEDAFKQAAADIERSTQDLTARLRTSLHLLPTRITELEEELQLLERRYQSMRRRVVPGLRAVPDMPSAGVAVIRHQSAAAG